MSALRTWCESESTCRRRPEHHGLGPGDTEVPDAVPVAHILPDQLAHRPGRGRLEAGHDLTATSSQR